MRVNELAKELGRPNKEVLEILQKNNQDVKSHSSNVNEEQIGMVRRALSSQKPVVPEAKAPAAGAESRSAAPSGQESRPASAQSQEARPAAGAEAPKKKIAAVYRPQNSQQRPQGQARNGRGQGQNGGRPAAGGARPQGQQGAGAGRQQSDSGRASQCPDSAPAYCQAAKTGSRVRPAGEGPDRRPAGEPGRGPVYGPVCGKAENFPDFPAGRNRPGPAAGSPAGIRPAAGSPARGPAGIQGRSPAGPGSAAGNQDWGPAAGSAAGSAGRSPAAGRTAGNQGVLPAAGPPVRGQTPGPAGCRSRKTAVRPPVFLRFQTKQRPGRPFRIPGEP